MVGMVRPGAIATRDAPGRDRVERIVLGAKRTWLERTLAGFKALTAVNFNRGSTLGGWGFSERGNTSLSGGVDYRLQVGDGRNNAIMLAALELLATAFAQSPVQVKQLVGDQENVVTDHEMVQRITKPNPYYGAELLWKATLIDYVVTGNAYWLKVRDTTMGAPVQFYWIPAHEMEPRWPTDNPKIYISHYEHTPNGAPEKKAVADVVHFRNGMDPRNIRKGLSPMGALMREIATDEEAAEMTHTVMRNLGVTGMVVSPNSDKGRISDADAAKIKASVMMRTTGDRRGEPLVVGGSVKVDQMSQDISKLDLSAIRHVPEERITAIVGTPAVLLGLGTGLENATFSNVDGLRRIFYENKVIPMQTFIASDLHTQLLPDYTEEPDGFTVVFDNSQVRVLQEDENDKVDRLLKELEIGGLTVNEYRAERGRDAFPVDMFMLSSRIIPVAVTDIVKKATVQDETDTGNNGGTDSNAGDDGNTSSADGSSAGDNKSYISDVRTKDIGDSIDRIRVRMVGQCANDVQVYLTATQSEVLRQIAEQSKAAANAKLRINWPRVQEDYEALRATLEPWYKRALTAVHDVVQDVLDTRYELSGADERTYLKAAGLNIRGINDTTRAAVTAALKTSVDLDETVEELTTRIVGLDVFSPTRSHLIAATELATATNLSQVESYKASSVVVGILVTDGDLDKVCADVNGKRIRIGEARSIPPLGHPNCRRRFTHITDSSELEDSEAA